MTNEATDNVSTNDYAEEVRTFKLTFAKELHRLADAANLCSLFDSIMNDAGLPARERHTEAGSRDENGDSEYDYRGDDIVTAEDNEADAKRWAVQASKALVNATEAYGHREVYDSSTGRYVRLTEFLEFFGMPTKQLIGVRVTGTFDITLDVDGWNEENLIDQVPTSTVASHVSNAIHFSDAGVQWKVSHADADSGS